MVKNLMGLRILFDASLQTSSRNLQNLSTLVPSFPVDLCTDLLYTVCSEHEMQFNLYLQHGSEPAADGVLTMLTIKRKQNRS